MTQSWFPVCVIQFVLTQGFIAERFSVRLLIVQCSQFTFVCMYIYIYMHALLRHDFCGLVPRLRVTWSGGDWRVKKIVRELKLEQEQSKRDRAREWKRKQDLNDNDSTTACIFAFGDSYDTSLISWNSSDNCFAIFTTIRRPQHLAWKHANVRPPLPSTYTLHVATMDIYLHISGYS